ncbi:MAG: alpha/beta hydrolase [Verrucomicrobiota bacterium]|jgi:endo-1,4-beta-xylanase
MLKSPLGALAALVLLVTPLSAAPAPLQPILPGGVIVPLYPETSPRLNAARLGEAETLNRSTKNPARIQSIVNIHYPSLEFHGVDAAANTGTAIIVVAGGGHRTLNVGPEGADLAPWLAKLGVNTIILRNRLRSDGYNLEKDAMPEALQAIRLVRSRAKAWKLDPTRIGIVGFSAGAELAAWTAVYFADDDQRARAENDPLAAFSSRPDFVGLIYPGPTPFTKNPDLPIARNAPPSFITSAGSGDRVHAIWADHYFAAMLKAGIPNLEMHIYGNGVHAGSIGERNGIPFGKWPERFVEWFRDLGFLSPSGTETKAARDLTDFQKKPVK